MRSPTSFLLCSPCVLTRHCVRSSSEREGSHPLRFSPAHDHVHPGIIARSNCESPTRPCSRAVSTLFHWFSCFSRATPVTFDERVRKHLTVDRQARAWKIDLHPCNSHVPRRPSITVSHGVRQVWWGIESPGCATSYFDVTS